MLLKSTAGWQGARAGRVQHEPKGVRTSQGLRQDLPGVAGQARSQGGRSRNR